MTYQNSDDFYIVDGRSIARSEISSLLPEEQRSLVVRWFSSNFSTVQPPALPKEILGYNARDEVEQEFRDLIDDYVLEGAIHEIDSGGNLFWQRVYDVEQSIDDPGPELDAGLTDRDDNEDEYAAEPELREDVLQRISSLERALDEVRRELRASKPPSIGHNNPPEDIEASASTAAHEVDTILASLATIKAQALKQVEQTDIAIVETETVKIEKAADSWGDWLKKRGEKAIDSAVDWSVKGTLSGLGIGTLYVLGPQLLEFAVTLRQWLHLLP